jgi:hypothetical protein
MRHTVVSLVVIAYLGATCAKSIVACWGNSVAGDEVTVSMQHSGKNANHLAEKFQRRHAPLVKPYNPPDIVHTTSPQPVVIPHLGIIYAELKISLHQNEALHLIFARPPPLT